MKYLDKLKEYKNMYLYIFLILVISPIFINIDPIYGINFDSYFWNKYKYPSVPLSAIVILILFLFNIKKMYLVNRFNLVALLVIGLITYIALNLYYLQNPRTIIVAMGMLLFIFSYQISRICFYKISLTSIYKAIYFSFIGIILIKLFFDVGIYQDIQNRDISMFVNNTAGNGKATYNVISQQKNHFLTMFFMTPKIAIYSYFTYFPYLYYLVVVFSVFNLLKKKMILLSLIMIVVSYIIVVNTNSRLFIYGIYFIPFLLGWYYITKSKMNANKHFLIYAIGIIIMTLLIGNYPFENIKIDNSLMSRYHHLQNYFENFEFLQIVFPFLNEYRQVIKGSLHNEFLEIFSFYGLILIIYLKIIKDIFINIDKRYLLISFLMMFILVCGSIIQLNTTNAYVGIISGVILGLLSNREKINDKYDKE